MSRRPRKRYEWRVTWTARVLGLLVVAAVALGFFAPAASEVVVAVVAIALIGVLGEAAVGAGRSTDARRRAEERRSGGERFD